jgi:hypothetical protein
LQKQGLREFLPFSTGASAETGRSPTEGCLMPGCAGCQRAPVPSQAPTLLFQIERRYRAKWNGLALTLQRDSSQWTLCVRDEARDKTLYTAYRGDESAARVAAAEFAITHVLGFASEVKPHHLANQLNWQEHR